MKTLLSTLMFLFFTLLVFAKDPTVVLTVDNTLSFNDYFYEESVSKLMKQARDLDSRVTSNDPIYLVINSPGGSIDDGLLLIQNLSTLRRPVHTITVFSASMGFQTVQGLGERLVLRDGTLMSHKPRGGFSGEFPGQLDSRYAYYLKKVVRMDENVVKRTNGKHTLKSYRSLIENEYWCDGYDCVDQGFADKVVDPSCDKSLSGTKKVTLDRFMYAGHTIELVVEYENCPININMLGYDIIIDKKALYDTKDEFSYFKSSTDLSPEVMFEIKQKINKLIQDRNSKAIKTY